MFTAGEAHGAKQGDLLYTFLTATHSPYCEADWQVFHKCQGMDELPTQANLWLILLVIQILCETG